MLGDFFKGLGGVLRSVGSHAADAVWESPNQAGARQKGMSEKDYDDFLETEKQIQKNELLRLQKENAAIEAEELYQSKGIGPGEKMDPGIAARQFANPGQRTRETLTNLHYGKGVDPSVAESIGGIAGMQNVGPEGSVLAYDRIGSGAARALSEAEEYDTERADTLATQERQNRYLDVAEGNLDVARGNLGVSRGNLALRAADANQPNQPSDRGPTENQARTRALSVYRMYLQQTKNPATAAQMASQYLDLTGDRGMFSPEKLMELATDPSFSQTFDNEDPAAAEFEEVLRNLAQKLGIKPGLNDNDDEY